MRIRPITLSTFLSLSLSLFLSSISINNFKNVPYEIRIHFMKISLAPSRILNMQSPVAASEYHVMILMYFSAGNIARNIETSLYPLSRSAARANIIQYLAPTFRQSS
jgi:hypothetical protein